MLHGRNNENVLQMTLVCARSQFFYEKISYPGGGGGAPIWNRRGCSSEILNLTPKGDHLGVAQAFCDP